MLRELDFVESDWAALFWALGGAASIFRHSVPRGLRAWLEKRRDQSQESVNETIGKKAAGVTAGIVIVLAVTSLAFVLVRQLFYAFPAWDLGSMPWWVAMIVIPEIISSSRRYGFSLARRHTTIHRQRDREQQSRGNLEPEWARNLDFRGYVHCARHLYKYISSCNGNRNIRSRLKLQQ
jgi:hypothetical protein